MILVHVTLLSQKTVFIIGHKMSMAEFLIIKQPKSIQHVHVQPPMQILWTLSCITSDDALRMSIL